MSDNTDHAFILDGNAQGAGYGRALDPLNLEDFGLVAGNSTGALTAVMVALGFGKETIRQQVSTQLGNAARTADDVSKRINDLVKQRLVELQDVVDAIERFSDNDSDDLAIDVIYNHAEVDLQAIKDALIADRETFDAEVITLKRTLDELKRHPEAYNFATHGNLMRDLSDLHIDAEMKDILLVTAEFEPIFSSLNDPPRFADMNGLSIAKAAAIVAFANVVFPAERASFQGADGEFADYEAVVGSIQTDAINRIDPTSQFAVNDPTDLVLEHLESLRDINANVLSIRLNSSAAGFDKREPLPEQESVKPNLDSHEKRKIERLNRNRHRVLEIDVQTSTARTVATKMASWQVMKEQRRDQDSASEKDTVNHLDERKILMKRRTAEAWRKQIKKHRKKKHRKKGSSSTSFSSSRRLFSPSDGQQEEHELSGTSIKK